MRPTRRRGLSVLQTKEMEPLLLVEDKNELRAMLRKALERSGYTVDEAPDGSAAIQKLRARRYQLVLSDLKMPGASGLDVLRESKQADATIPVILLTASSMEPNAVSKMTGMVESACLDSRRKSRPDAPGIFKSVTTIW